MRKPKAYDPEYGYRYQIFCRCRRLGREWEHCDYAVGRSARDHLLANYWQAYGPEFDFKVVMLPWKYWKAEVKCGAE